MATVTTSALTLAQARERVSNIINEEMSGQFGANAIDGHLNACGMRIYQAMNIGSGFTAYRDTGVGTYEYLVAESDLYNGQLHIDGVYVDGDSISAEAFSPLTDDDILSTGKPSTYMVDGEKLVLKPTPDAAYRLKVVYRRDYEAPTATSDTFPLNDLQVEACILYAAYMMKLMDEEYQAASMLKTQYEDTYMQATRIPTGIYKNVQVPTY